MGKGELHQNSMTDMTVEVPANAKFALNDFRLAGWAASKDLE
jgi:hypothetical protein